MANIFKGVEIEPSEFEIAIQQLFLQGLQAMVAETGDFTGAVLASLGFKRGAEGDLVQLTEQERFETLGPAEQETFNIMKQQAERLKRAFEGDIPISEALRQRSEEQFQVLQEEQARRGQPITGVDLESAVGFSTPAIQSIGERQRTQGLLVDEEQRQERERGLQGLLASQGFLSDVGQRNLANLLQVPGRLDIGGGSGLLSTAAQRGKFAAESEIEAQAGLTGLLGDLFGPSITSLIGKLIP